MIQIKEKIRDWGMVKEKSFQPKANGILFNYHDAAIIEYYRRKAQGLLEYYRPGTNFYEIKKAVDYQMRYSLIHTLAGKHKKKVHEIIQEYGKTPSVHIPGREPGKTLQLAGFLTPAEIQQRNRGFSIKEDPGQYQEIFNRPIAKLSLPKQVYRRCGVMGCLKSDIEVHHLRKLQLLKLETSCPSRGWQQLQLLKQQLVPSVPSQEQAKGYLSAKSKKERTQRALQTIESAFTGKQIPLCKDHYQALHVGELDIHTLDKEYIDAKVRIIGGGALKSRSKK
jgi:hypothetical protein